MGAARTVNDPRLACAPPGDETRRVIVATADRLRSTVNASTAKTLGLAIPPALQLRITRTIE